MPGALYDAWPIPQFSYDEERRRLSTVWKVRAPRGLALQSPMLPARGDTLVFQGDPLVVKGRRIRGLDRFNSADEADDLTEIDIEYGPDIDTFSGGSPVDPDDPDVVLIRGAFEPYDIEIPYHIFEVVTVPTDPANPGGGNTVFAVFTPSPATYEATVERVELQVNIELFGAPERAAIRAQRGRLHALDGVNRWAYFDGASYEQIGGNLTKVYFSWRELLPITLDPTPVQNVYKPGDGAQDETPLTPFARWAALPGAEVGSGHTLRREAPIFKVFNRPPDGDIDALPGNPLFYLLNGTAAPGGGS